MKIIFQYIIIVLFTLPMVSCEDTNDLPGRTGMITFTESDVMLQNPHRGFQTEGRTLSEETSLTKYKIPSSSIYRRFYWYQLEPQEGQYDFSEIDDLLNKGKKENQCLSFRVMCIASPGDSRNIVPKWFQDKGGHHWYLSEGNYIPDMDDPLFKQYMYGLIRKLGERYADDPRLDMIDIGIIGFWGEWHNDDGRFPIPSVQTRKEIIDLFCEVFPNQNKIINLESFEDDILQYAVHKGCGVRTDGMGEKWHENDFFPENYSKIPDAWKYAPISGEAYDLINEWDNPNWLGGGRNNGLIKTIDNALARHQTFFHWMHGSYTNSGDMLKEVKRFEKYLGYRLVLKEFKSDVSLKPNEKYNVSIKWENTGVAPPYFDYYLSFLFVKEDGTRNKVITSTTIKDWLPGEIITSESVLLPVDMPAGEYTVYVGLTGKETKKAEIQLAIDCKHIGNWYKMKKIIVKQ